MVTPPIPGPAAEVPARLVLLRHALAAGAAERCVGRRPDPPLGALGREQAVAAARRLGRDFDLVVSSPARRALATAAAFGLPVEVDERLAERCFGVWEGRAWAEVWATVPAEVLDDPAAYAAFTPPGGEPLVAVAARVAAALRQLTDPPGRRVLAVTHAGPLRLAVGAALGLEPGRVFALGADHARAAVLARYGRAWVLERLNG
jgi:broad specificity phosphatase PhoE